MRTLKTSLLVFILSISAFAQWYQLNSGTNSSLGTVQFVNGNIGWINALGSGMYEIYKTTNGGSDWNLQYSQNDPITRVLFLNENVGWLLSHHAWVDEIYKTTNGGG